MVIGAVHSRPALATVEHANRLALGAAGLAHVAMLACSALCWRSAFRTAGATIDRRDACLRYGVGTLVNTVAPARAGAGLRIALFARAFEDSRPRRSAAAMVAIGIGRSGSLLLLLVVGLGIGALPLPFASIPAALAIVALIARRTRRAVGTKRLLDTAVWGCGATACRLASVTLAVVATGVGHELRYGVVGLLALEGAGLVPLAPGLAGVGGVAVGLALAADGMPTATALGAGIAFHVAEGVAGLVFGAVATTTLAIRSQLRFARTTPHLHRSLTHGG